MAQTVEVRFKGTRRAFFTWPHDDDPLRLQESVIVDVERGQDFGRVNSVGEVAAKKCGGSCSCPVTEKAGGADETGGSEPAVNGANGSSEVVAELAAVQPDADLTFAPDAGLSLPAETLAEAAPEAVAPAPQEPAKAALPTIVRRAQQPDIAQANELRRAEEDDRRRIVAKAREHGLEMKVSDVEWQWDRRRLTVYFTAEQRVDFRALVRDLAQAFRTRIELRQIGVRDEAARLGGVGRCGRAFCCSTWLTELSPVNLVLAKDQHLSLNPQQISGGCGRLLCCLKYEHEFYVAARKRFPREGKTLTTSRGAEKVIAVDIFRERVFLRGEEEQRIIGLAELREEIEMAEKGDTTVRAATAEKPSAPAAPAAPRSRPRERTQDRAPAPSPKAEAAAPPAPAPPDSPATPAAPSSSSRRRRRRRRRNPPPTQEG